VDAPQRFTVSNFVENQSLEETDVALVIRRTSIEDLAEMIVIWNDGVAFARLRASRSRVLRGHQGETDDAGSCRHDPVARTWPSLAHAALPPNQQFCLAIASCARLVR
jgi:hypothetical protein